MRQINFLGHEKELVDYAALLNRFLLCVLTMEPIGSSHRNHSQCDKVILQSYQICFLISAAEIVNDHINVS